MSLAKKWMAVASAVFVASLLSTPSLAADPAPTGGGGEAKIIELLTLIAKYTHDTLDRVNDLPTYITGMLAFANNMTSPDKSDSTPSLQSAFTTLTNAHSKNISSQLGFQQQLTSDFFATSDIPVTKKSLPNANDLAYQTMLGQSYFNPDPRENKETNTHVDPAYNYIKNASGLNIPHMMYNNTWQGSIADQKKYLAFYNTISAVQTYNSYVLSYLYAEYKNNNSLANAQTALLQQATKPEWFTEIASENIGAVFRQMLMYESQTYVLLSQIANNQKQLLMSQSMTNTLLILGNQFTENSLLSKAVRP